MSEDRTMMSCKEAGKGGVTGGRGNLESKSDTSVIQQIEFQVAAAALELPVALRLSEEEVREREVSSQRECLLYKAS